MIAFETQNLRNNETKGWINKLRLIAKLPHIDNCQKVLFEFDHLIGDILVEREQFTSVLDELERRTTQFVLGAELMRQIFVGQLLVDLLRESINQDMYQNQRYFFKTINSFIYFMSCSVISPVTNF